MFYPLASCAFLILSLERVALDVVCPAKGPATPRFPAGTGEGALLPCPIG